VEEEKILKQLGKRFRKARLEAGLTQAELAARIDKDQQSIQRFEKGRINPTYLYLLEVCEGLGVQISMILDKNSS
jgi:transcriptional regulator with XRE-family HTH domain